ncbi:MAG: hypothetical protein ACE5DK_10625, partial [Paracoccaceae bacterium]
MYIATLITNPVEPVLSVANVLPYHDQLGGGEFRWLLDGVACEFPIRERPEKEKKIWQNLQDRGVGVLGAGLGCFF